MKKITHLVLLNLSLISFFAASAQTTAISKMTSTGTGFEEQLSALLQGSADHFESLKGEKIKPTEFKSKVALDGAVSTRVTYTIAREVFVIASFGYFDKEADAYKKYKDIIEQVSDAKKPITMVKMEEIINSETKDQPWIQFGGDCVMTVTMLKLLKIGKDFSTSDQWLVKLKIQ